MLRRHGKGGAVTYSKNLFVAMHARSYQAKALDSTRLHLIWSKAKPNTRTLG